MQLCTQFKQKQWATVIGPSYERTSKRVNSYVLYSEEITEMYLESGTWRFKVIARCLVGGCTSRGLILITVSFSSPFDRFLFTSFSFRLTDCFPNVRKQRVGRTMN